MTFNRETILTVDEIAQHLKVPRSWVYENARRGTIPFTRVGKYLRFRASEVEASLKQRSLKTEYGGKRRS